MKYFILLIGLFQWGNCFEMDERSICWGKNVTSEPVIQFCDEVGGTLLYRCCRGDDNATFLAVDLMDANLTTAPDFTYSENLNLSVIDLRNNPDLKLSSTGDEFLTLTYLNDLLVPIEVQCPGGLKVWETITKTTDPEGYYCKNQIDICSNSMNLCVEDETVCSGNGPNHFLCLCKSDYHGYKCLRYGAFPTWIFLGSTIGITFLLSIFLYWTQRRHVIK
jgi:hypothetical protein